MSLLPQVQFYCGPGGLSVFIGYVSLQFSTRESRIPLFYSYPKATGIRRQLVSCSVGCFSNHFFSCFDFIVDIKIHFDLCFSVCMGNQEADFRKNIEDWAFQMHTKLV